MTYQRKIQTLYEKKNQMKMNEDSKVKLQQSGKLNARERILKLLDDKSFIELYGFLGDSDSNDGVICGYGTIDNRPIYIYSQDVTNLNGALGKDNVKKISGIFDMAVKNGTIVIGFWDSLGAKIEDGIEMIAGMGELINKQVAVSGVIPQISAVMGSCFGSATYSLAISDFIFAVDDSKIASSSYRSLEKGTSNISDKEFGGADFNATKSGIAHFISDSEEECLNEIRRLVGFLPDNNLTDSDIVVSDDLNRLSPKLNSIMNEEDISYDIKDILREISDNNNFFEIHRNFAPNMITGFARLGGISVGIVSNQQAENNGLIDIDSADKAGRFIRFCDAFNIPIITFVDSEGYVASAEQEERGLIRHGAKLFYAYSEATVPKINIILGKAYGSSLIAMGCFSKDIMFAWPTAEISITCPDATASILYSEEISSIETRKNKISEYKENIATPYEAAKIGIIEDIIEPSATRQKIISALEIFISKRENRPVKKHGNIPC